MGCAHGALTSSVVDPVGASLSGVAGRVGLDPDMPGRGASVRRRCDRREHQCGARRGSSDDRSCPCRSSANRGAPDVPLSRDCTFIPQVWPSGESTPGECYVPIRNIGPAPLGRVRLAMDVGRQTAVRGTTAERPASAMRLSRVRSTLPVGVRGIRSRKTISSGAL